MQFPQPEKDPFSTLYLEDTDKQLPERINVNTRYAFFKTIARGGKCVIQSCKDLHLSRVICYKSLRQELHDDRVEQQRFLREARVTAMLQHPNTVPVYELGRNNHGYLYFTMKLVHGYTLRELLDPRYRDRYDLQQLLDVLIQIGHALNYAHTHGVIHRDIKPENILVGPFGEVLLLDWGLAKVWDRDGVSPEPPESAEPVIDSDDLSLTGQGKLQGTISYMSPEQIERDPGIDARTDIFSLGVILYEILSGALPTSSEKFDDILREIKEAEPPPPSARTGRAVPKRLEKLAMACITKRPDDRIPSAAELVRQLQNDWRS